MSATKKLIEEELSLEAEDLANDFVESQLGRFYFVDSWKKRRQYYFEMLRLWLKSLKRDELVYTVGERLDWLAGQGLPWNDAGDPRPDVPNRT